MSGNRDDNLDPTLDFLAGTIAGASGLVVGFPFDTVKYRFQNPSPDVRYRSTFHALSTIMREERLGGLYKGISSPLATAPLLNGMLFATYRFLMKLQTRNDSDAQDQEQQQPTLGQVFLAGAGCGLVSTLLTTPIELIKIQQQKQQQQHTHDTGHIIPLRARAIAQHVYRAGGIRGLYRGLSATIMRDVGGFGLYFYGYEGSLRLFTPARPTPHHQYQHHYHDVDPAPEGEEVVVVDTLTQRPWAPLLLAGGAAGILGWVVTFPFDVLKTRMQVQQQQQVAICAPTRTSLWRTAWEMYVEAGGRVFWRGLVPTIIRAVPVNMAVFGTFQGVVWAFS